MTPRQLLRMTSSRVKQVPIAVLALWMTSHGALVTAQRDTLQLPGLRAPVEIVTDRWGINHIYAENEADLFFAQGYAAARDRLFQFEIWRRQATGTVAEILGRRELERDVGARLHRSRRPDRSHQGRARFRLARITCRLW